MERIGLAVALALSLILAPLASAEQAKAQRVGVLMSGTPQGGERLLHELREGLRELGYTEGQNLIVHLRFAEGRLDRLVDLMSELGNLGVDVIFGTGPAVVRAAESTSRRVPLVALDLESDPIEAGFVKSLARPAGNITGIFLDQPELSGKWLELLKDAIPGISRVAVLWDRGTALPQLDSIQVAAKALGVKLQRLEVARAEDLENAFVAAANGRAHALVILSSPLFFRESARVADLAARKRVPAISLFADFPMAGGLMAYGPNLFREFRHAATFVDKVLKGTSVGDIPVERPATFELVINLKTARALGLTIPQSLLLRADHLIE